MESHMSPWRGDGFTTMTYDQVSDIDTQLPWANYLYNRTPPPFHSFLMISQPSLYGLYPMKGHFLEGRDWAHSHAWTIWEHYEELHSLGSLDVVRIYSINGISWLSCVWIHDEKMVNRDQVVDIGNELPQLAQYSLKVPPLPPLFLSFSMVSRDWMTFFCFTNCIQWSVILTSMRLGTRTCGNLLENNVDNNNKTVELWGFVLYYEIL